MCDITFETWDDILSGQEKFAWILSEHYIAIYLFNNEQFPVAFAFKLRFIWTYPIRGIFGKY